MLHLVILAASAIDITCGNKQTDTWTNGPYPRDMPSTWVMTDSGRTYAIWFSSRLGAASGRSRSWRQISGRNTPRYVLAGAAWSRQAVTGWRAIFITLSQFLIHLITELGTGGQHDRKYWRRLHGPGWKFTGSCSVRVDASMVKLRGDDRVRRSRCRSIYYQWLYILVIEHFNFLHQQSVTSEMECNVQRTISTANEKAEHCI